MPNPACRADEELRWHQALAYALLGRVVPGLGCQNCPDVAALLADLEGRYADGRAGLIDDIARARGSGGLSWPRAVPAELRAGLGAAQFAALLGELRAVLEIDDAPRRTVSDRPPDAAEQALIRDVPPHY